MSLLLAMSLPPPISLPPPMSLLPPMSLPPPMSLLPPMSLFRAMSLPPRMSMPTSISLLAPMLRELDDMPTSRVPIVSRDDLSYPLEDVEDFSFTLRLLSKLPKNMELLNAHNIFKIFPALHIFL